MYQAEMEKGKRLPPLEHTPGGYAAPPRPLANLSGPRTHTTSKQKAPILRHICLRILYMRQALLLLLPPPPPLNRPLIVCAPEPVNNNFPQNMFFTVVITITTTTTINITTCPRHPYYPRHKTSERRAADKLLIVQQ